MELKDVITLIISGIVTIIVITYLIINERGNIKEWLIQAVTKAEKELGGGTGQLKLRTVYDWFIEKFPIVAVIIPFKVFSAWVDYALTEMRCWLSQNYSIKKYVEDKENG